MNIQDSAQAAYTLDFDVWKATPSLWRDKTAEYLVCCGLSAKAVEYSRTMVFETLELQVVSCPKYNHDDLDTHMNTPRKARM